MLSKCIEFCRQYENNPNVVYKTCGDYIVVLEKQKDTLTNENRTGIVDPMHAKFRADKLKVLCIFHKQNPNIQQYCVENTMYLRKKCNTLYMCGSVIKVSNYNKNLSEVCTTGLHYFKSVEAAYYYGLNIKDCRYTGEYITWRSSGQIATHHEYINGQVSAIIYCFSL
jgi:hypothetical protein